MDLPRALKLLPDLRLLMLPLYFLALSPVMNFGMSYEKSFYNRVFDNLNVLENHLEAMHAAQPEIRL